MTLDISAIRQRIEKAQLGDDHAHSRNDGILGCSICRVRRDARLELAAHAPADLLSLLEEVEALTDKIEEQRCFYEDLCTKLVADLTPPASTPSESS